MDKQDENLVVVFTSEDQVQQTTVEDALRDAGIEYVVHPHEIVDYLQSTELNSGSQIMVLEENVDKAEAIIAQVLAD